MKIVKINAMWCPGYLRVDKLLKNISAKYSIKLEEYDYDFDSEEIKYYNVPDILPVLIFLDEEDNELTRLVGQKSEEDIINIINKYNS